MKELIYAISTGRPDLARILIISSISVLFFVSLFGIKSNKSSRLFIKRNSIVFSFKIFDLLKISSIYYYLEKNLKV